MGSGKTCAMINEINKTDDKTKFLYVTPYLDEVDRVIEKCSKKRFKQPESFGTKLNGLKYLLNNKENIVSTHKLFSMLDDEAISMIKEQNYVLVMDEVMELIEPFHITTYDMSLVKNHVYENEHGFIKWRDKNYKGVFDSLKQQCDSGNVAVYSNNILLWLFPVETFYAFSKVFILTYHFESQIQKYYYDLYKIQYNKLYVHGNSADNYELKNTKAENAVYDYSQLIHIFEHTKLNNIGKSKTSLSKSWYEKYSSDAKTMQVLKNNCYSYFRYYMNTKSSLNLWTTFKTYRNQIRGKGYARGFLSSNMRATNEFRDKIAIAYLVNKYFNPVIKNFLISRGIEVNEDLYALSEMLQFIWRSAIRDGKEIWVYIPSSRMRNLLKDWIESTKNNEVII